MTERVCRRDKPPRVYRPGDWRAWVRDAWRQIGMDEDCIGALPDDDRDETPEDAA